MRRNCCNNFFLTNLKCWPTHLTHRSSYGWNVRRRSTLSNLCSMLLLRKMKERKVRERTHAFISLALSHNSFILGALSNLLFLHLFFERASLDHPYKKTTYTKIPPCKKTTYFKRKFIWKRGSRMKSGFLLLPKVMRRASLPARILAKKNFVFFK